MSTTITCTRCFCCLLITGNFLEYSVTCPFCGRELPVSGHFEDLNLEDEYALIPDGFDGSDWSFEDVLN